MKTLVGLLIVGMCLISSICYSEEIEANNFIRVILSNGEGCSCNEPEINSGCRISVDDKFVTVVNKPVVLRSNTSNIAFMVETAFINYKFPMNNVISIEYR